MVSILNAFSFGYKVFYIIKNIFLSIKGQWKSILYFLIQS